MKVNRERFLIAALALSTAAGCKLSRDDVTAQAAPEIPGATGALPGGFGTDEESQVGAGQTAGQPSTETDTTGKATTKGSRLAAPAREGLATAPAKEAGVSPTKEAGVSPTKEYASPTKEAGISPTKEVGVKTSPTKETAIKTAPTAEIKPPPPPPTKEIATKK